MKIAVRAARPAGWPVRSAPRWRLCAASVAGGPPRSFDSPSAPAAGGPRSRNFGPDAKPQRGGAAKGKKKDQERPRGPIPLKNTGRSFTLEDAELTDDASLADVDDFATSKPNAEPDTPDTPDADDEKD